MASSVFPRRSLAESPYRRRFKKNIGKLVKNLRERKFPVFPEEVMNEVGCKCNRGHLVCILLPERQADARMVSQQHMKFLTGPLRPLEEPRKSWYTEANLEAYFRVAVLR